MGGTVIPITARQGEFAILQLAWPGRPLRNIGVLLRDPGADRLWPKLTEEWAEDSDPEYLEEVAGDLEVRAGQMGAGAFLDWCRDTLSNALRITDLREVEVDSFARVRESLFTEYVEPVVVRPFETHLPLYSLRAAAGKFGHEQDVQEEAWVNCAGRLNARMFLARVTGRSMEPRIPDGSLNIFEGNIVGSRQDMIVLAELPGFTDSTARYTVKKYSSVKRSEGDSWRHESVTLLPINREFEPIEVAPDEVIIVARWVATLE